MPIKSRVHERRIQWRGLWCQQHIGKKRLSISREVTSTTQVHWSDVSMSFEPWRSGIRQQPGAMFVGIAARWNAITLRILVVAVPVADWWHRSGGVDEVFVWPVRRARTRPRSDTSFRGRSQLLWRGIIEERVNFNKWYHCYIFWTSSVWHQILWKITSSHEAESHVAALKMWTTAEPFSSASAVVWFVENLTVEQEGENALNSSRWIFRFGLWDLGNRKRIAIISPILNAYWGFVRRFGAKMRDLFWFAAYVFNCLRDNFKNLISFHDAQLKRSLWKLPNSCGVSFRQSEGRWYALSTNGLSTNCTESFWSWKDIFTIEQSC